MLPLLFLMLLLHLLLLLLTAAATSTHIFFKKKQYVFLFQVLLHLFRERGPSFLETTRVCGMFSFACYDSRSDALVVARDPVGIIPLYVGWGKEGSVWFASEMKALQGCCDHYEAFPPGKKKTAGISK